MENSKKTFTLLLGFKKVKERISKIFRFTDRKWYPLAVSAMTAADVFVGVIPSDALLVSAVIGQPKKWIKIGLMFAIGNFLGAALLAGIVYWDADLLREFFPQFFQSTTWLTVASFMEKYGGFALFLGIMGPFPIQPFIILPILSGFSVKTLLIIYFFSRLFKVSIISWLASHTPKLLARWSLGLEDKQRVLKEINKGT
jgi:membrane protein YqaA with SNARE-associated domain